MAVNQDVPMSAFTVRMPTATKERLEQAAESLRQSRDVVLSEAVESYLEIYDQQIAQIHEGLADLDAGRVYTQAEMQDLVREFEHQAANNPMR